MVDTDLTDDAHRVTGTDQPVTDLASADTHVRLNLAHFTQAYVPWPRYHHGQGDRRRSCRAFSISRGYTL